jgi:ABC-type polar amino acid transport system ATPase subunit
VHANETTQRHDSGAPQPVIRVRGLGKRFGAFRALEAIDLEIVRGQKVVVCGPSGSGKSTLIRCLNALEEFQNGEVTVLGHDVSRAAGARFVRENVGMVFQQFNLFPHLTVLENLVLAPIWVRRMPRREAEAQARSYLAKVRLPEQEDKYPAQLSGGQQQRVAIARALCMRPQVMLFDEPTSALDPEMVHEVLETMLALSGTGMTMICVTHELDFARRFADRVVFMDQGSIAADAPTSEFFERPACERARQFLASWSRVT